MEPLKGDALKEYALFLLVLFLRKILDIRNGMQIEPSFFFTGNLSIFFHDDDYKNCDDEKKKRCEKNLLVRSF